MAQCFLPKEILWDMQRAGVLPFSVVVTGRLDNSTQLVECTPETAAWCRQEARLQPSDSEKAYALLAMAETIDRACQKGGDTGS
jgi:hypothetical protein